MSPEPAPARRESTFVTVLLFPFRAIEQARGWRRLGLLALYVVIGRTLLALVWRRSQRIGLPDVGNPRVCPGSATRRCWRPMTSRLTEGATTASLHKDSKAPGAR
ncbi:MAG TPA: hypothetical protein VFF52_20080 [Isosphaeraceae bacterium]|nr:hypothetical protein [Isosphaeraceae bacterium]